jgi:plastocyanin
MRKTICGTGIGRWRTFAAVLGGFLLLTGASIVAVPGSANAAPAVVIKMTDKPPKYIPEKVTIKVGQSIKWVNDAKTLHSVTGDPDSAQNPSDVSLPPGAKPFDSGFMPPDATFEHAFKVPGTYKYLCVPHEKDGMIGYVVVKK